MKIDPRTVKELREKTGAGVMDCNTALAECSGSVSEAIEWLRRKGHSAAEKKSTRTASQGLIGAYVHFDGKTGVLLEINCETDFVAKTDEFKELSRDICLQIVATSPKYLSRDHVPADVIEKEKQAYAKDARQTGKPEKTIEKIVAGRLEKFYAEDCLFDQPFVKNQDITIQGLIKEKIARLGENIVLRRFARFKVGEPA